MVAKWQQIGVGSRVQSGAIRVGRLGEVGGGGAEAAKHEARPGAVEGVRAGIATTLSSTGHGGLVGCLAGWSKHRGRR